MILTLRMVSYSGGPDRMNYKKIYNKIYNIRIYIPM